MDATKQPITVGFRISLANATRIAAQLDTDVESVVECMVAQRIRASSGMSALITAASRAMQRPDATVLLYITYDEIPDSRNVDLWLS